MPRKISLSIDELLAELTRRQSKLPRLQKQAARLQKQLAVVTGEIEALGGAVVARAKPGPKPGKKSAKAKQAKPAKPAAKKVSKRPRNKMNLSVALLGVLSKTEPMSVKAIIEAVKMAGYKTSSKNFATIVYQTLSREKKRVEKVGRGIYKLKG
jgi:hypothetical protein